MPNLGNMTGTPWHVETLTRAEGDPRRHRSRCLYFRKEDAYCCKYEFRCFGSAHCSSYKEKAGIENHRPQSRHAQRKKDNPLAQPSKTVAVTEEEPVSAESFFPSGSTVEHVKYGMGQVIATEGSRVTVQFKDKADNPMTFDASFCHERGFLKIVPVKNDEADHSAFQTGSAKEEMHGTDPVKNHDSAGEDAVVTQSDQTIFTPHTSTVELSVPREPICAICKNSAEKQTLLTKDGRTIRVTICSDCLNRLQKVSYVSVDKVEDIVSKRDKLEPRNSDYKMQNLSTNETEPKKYAVNKKKRTILIVIFALILLILAVGITLFTNQLLIARVLEVRQNAVLVEVCNSPDYRWIDRKFGSAEGYEYIKLYVKNPSRLVERSVLRRRHSPGRREFLPSGHWCTVDIQINLPGHKKGSIVP